MKNPNRWNGKEAKLAHQKFKERRPDQNDACSLQRRNCPDANHQQWEKGRKDETDPMRNAIKSILTEFEQEQ